MKLKILFIIAVILMFSCNNSKKSADIPIQQSKKNITAKYILGNPEYLAISYGGYRAKTRDVQPTIKQLKEDLKILSAMNIKILRTYNTKLKQAHNLLQAIKQLKKEDPSFEMYVMLGAWIDCEHAWDWSGDGPNHDTEDIEANTAEIERAVQLANEFPDIVKIIAVGNEAMVHWATSYYVKPAVILKWVNYLQNLKKEGKLPKELWITSSDNFASWGGDTKDYHNDDLVKLIKAVDYLSVHTYPFHDTHYNSDFWNSNKEEKSLSNVEKIDAAMLRAKNHAISQYQSVTNYLKGLGIDKPIHIGETGWASVSDGFYGNSGSKAADEYKQGLFYKHMRDWTNKNGMSCFYFEAFDEIWKDAKNPIGSENHFGLFTIDGKAKYAIWELVDNNLFNNLTRDGNPITKTYNGNKEDLLSKVMVPPTKNNLTANH